MSKLTGDYNSNIGGVNGDLQTSNSLLVCLPSHTRPAKNWGYKMRTWKYIVVVIIFTILTYQMVFAEDWSDIEIADAIYLAEGGAKAKVPYGILSVKVKDEAEARQVCLNTIRNNRKRYADYGHKQYATYLEFLASRYCPIGAGNDPKGLNQNWLKNVKYFLEKGAKK